METVLRYELSGDGQGVKKYIKNLDPAANVPYERFYHVHFDEMTELERWIHGLLSTPNAGNEARVSRSPPVTCSQFETTKGTRP